jgi:hypothetical protein
MIYCIYKVRKENKNKEDEEMEKSIFIIYDVEDDIIAIVETEAQAKKVAAYYGGWYEEEF